MKSKLLSIFVALTLIFSTMCGNLIAFADTSETESKYLDDKTYHHLDMGVTVAIGRDGVYDDGLTYGKMVALSSPIPITFGNKIEVTGCHWFNPDGISNGSESFKFSHNDGDSWNIVVNTPEKGR